MKATRILSIVGDWSVQKAYLKNETTCNLTNVTKSYKLRAI